MDTGDFRNGLSILYNNEIYTIVEFQHVKPGKGGAFVRSKMKNLRTGATLDRTWNAGEKIEPARLERKVMQFLYSDGADFYLMDMESFEQVTVDRKLIGDKEKYLKENTEVQVIIYKDEIVQLTAPDFMELIITDTDPGFRGDTASGGSKPATLETGAVIRVPLFVNLGEKVRVDTRTDTYLERVK